VGGARLSIVGALLAFVLVGCGSSPSGPNAIGLRFSYVGVAPAGRIDQTVSITNPSDHLAAIPTLSFRALDENSHPVPGVSVITVYGSDRGLVVVPAHYEVFDIVRFEGADAGRVKTVKVTVKKVRTFEDSGTTYPKVGYVDVYGHSVEYPFEARTVRVTNPGDSGYVVRLVGIKWNDPLPGHSQQVSAVTPIGVPVRVAAHSHLDVPLTSADAAQQYDTVKAYISVK
jgi:hypothetical protein